MLRAPPGGRGPRPVGFPGDLSDIRKRQERYNLHLYVVDPSSLRAVSGGGLTRRCGTQLPRCDCSLLMNKTTAKEQAFQPDHYINRELSWLEFNARVLEEAQDSTTPLLERVKFLSIFSSNLDEFFMVRVAGLREQAFASEAPQDYNPDGLKAIAQLRQIAARTRQLVADQYRCWTKSVFPALADEGIVITSLSKVKDTSYVDRFFQETVFPIITPMAIDPSHPRPRYHNRSLYIGLMFAPSQRDRSQATVCRRASCRRSLPRLVPVRPGERTFVYLEDLVAARLPELFGGHEVLTFAPFRITRDSDLDLIEQESDDMLRMIEERLKERRRSGCGAAGDRPGGDRRAGGNDC